MLVAVFIRNTAVAQEVQGIFERAAFSVETFDTEIALLRKIRRQKFDLLLIDIGTGLDDSESIFSWLNCRSGDLTPVMVISTMRNAELVALALNAGADDFIHVPYEPVEFIARANALLRRGNHQVARRTIDLRGYLLNRETSTASYKDQPIELTPREFTMAWLFFSTPGVYISRETIGTSIWGTDSEIAGRTIEQHVYKLRKKLQLGTERGVIIRTAYSGGYRLEFYGTEPVIDATDQPAAAQADDARSLEEEAPG